MVRRLAMAATAILAIGVLTTAEARKKESDNENLVVISEQSVDLSNDRYSVDVRKARGGFTGIRVRAKTGTHDVSRVQIVYSDGSVHNEDRRIDMKPGERSKPINPTSSVRFVDQINVAQRPGRGKGVIQILGVQTAEARKAKRPTSSTPPPAKDDAVSKIETRPTSDKETTTLAGRQTEGGDVMFGAQYVGFGVDRDTIRVGSEIGKFDRIRMRVLDNDIYINELKVVYSNGETDALAVNANVPRNSRTNWIDLKGDRFLKEIQMSYRSKPNIKGQARIEVLGHYADGWLGPNGEGRKFNQGWVLLGAQTAGFVGFDKDVIPVGKNEGGFHKVRVTVKDRAITLNEMKILYVGGSSETIPVRTRVDAGGTYGPIDLKNSSRGIDRIEAKYRSRIFSKGTGSAIVEVWGQH